MEWFLHENILLDLYKFILKIGGTQPLRIGCDNNSGPSLLKRDGVILFF
jgi:hypothetical protein